MASLSRGLTVPTVPINSGVFLVVLIFKHRKTKIRKHNDTPKVAHSTITLGSTKTSIFFSSLQIHFSLHFAKTVFFFCFGPQASRAAPKLNLTSTHKSFYFYLPVKFNPLFLKVTFNSAIFRMSSVPINLNIYIFFLNF